jgi:hypothetical protein
VTDLQVHDATGFDVYNHVTINGHLYHYDGVRRGNTLIGVRRLTGWRAMARRLWRWF